MDSYNYLIYRSDKIEKELRKCDFTVLRHQIMKQKWDALRGEDDFTYDLLTDYEELVNDQYEAHLKADMVAMLTEIQLEIQKFSGCSCSCSDGVVDDIYLVLQSRICNKCYVS